MGGPWLSQVGTSNSHSARLTRALTNHDPIGEYCACFNLSNEVRCNCNFIIPETRQHILHRCPRYKHSSDRSESRDLDSLLEFLENNPTTFAFPSAIPPPPFPKARKKRQKRQKPLHLFLKKLKKLNLSNFVHTTVNNIQLHKSTNL